MSEIDYVKKIQELAKTLPDVRIMEVCGGHTTSLFIATLLAFLFKLNFPSWFFELIVGVVLIILGLRLLLKKSIGHVKHQFAIGLLHGLAGTATLIVIMASMTSTIWESILFILLFGIGSIVGMSLVSFSLTEVLKKFALSISNKFTFVVAISSMGIGFYKIILIFFL